MAHSKSPEVGSLHPPPKESVPRSPPLKPDENRSSNAQPAAGQNDVSSSVFSLSNTSIFFS